MTQLTDGERAAVAAFAAEHGRQWKRELADVYWPNARIWETRDGDKAHGYTLHRLRNSHGPEWLVRYKLSA